MIYGSVPPENDAEGDCPRYHDNGKDDDDDVDLLFCPSWNIQPSALEKGEAMKCQCKFCNLFISLISLLENCQYQVEGFIIS